MATKLIPVSLAALVLAGCAPKPVPEIQWQAFDGNRAFANARKLVSFGPRPSGSPALAKCATYLSSQLQDFGLDAEEQTFLAPTPRGPVQFRNIVSKTRGPRGGPGQIILIGAHYDTKWFTNMTFVGANDGASGAAVLLEMARVASTQPNLWFVFFDGEEAARDYGAEDGLHGSKFFVEDLKGAGRVNWLRAAIILDMVGDRQLNITMPVNSDAQLVEQVFESARDAGYRDFFSYGNNEITDDHTPFRRAGIAAVDLIDFQYGSGPGLNDFWHTDKDTLDKISPHSLEIAGQTTLRLISRLQKPPGR
jgi:Zn-dependent M28 family amino/carboxypeptidase